MSTVDESSPRSLELFGGEQLESFGDIGIFGQLMTSSETVSPFRSAGIRIAPDLFRKEWGAMQWSNKIGFGSYRGATTLTLATGFTIETGSYFHINLEVLNAPEVNSGDDGGKPYPTMFGVGLGLHF